MDVMWDQALIEKYNHSGPRYTSYPTALEFSEDFSDASFIKACQKNPQRPLSLYVHIPFCHKMCYYCACSKVITRHSSKADAYLDALEKEVQQRSLLLKERTVTQLHWGGGTPTFLTPIQRQRLVSMLRQHFNFSSSVEMSIEIDPRSIDVDELAGLRELGFNRMSLGVQDFNHQVQVAINRVQDALHIQALLEKGKELGFASTNIDLIYGLPLQTPDNFNLTLQKALELDPARISVFNYAHLPNMFPAQRKLNEDDLPSPQYKLEILQNTIALFTQAGYQFIGMDHFAKPNDELAIAQRNGVLHRNFQGYTTHADCDLLGLGVTSISMIGNVYSQNRKDLKEYQDCVTLDGSALWRGIELIADDLIRREVIKELMCNFYVDIKRIESLFNIDFFTYFAQDLGLLQTFIQDGLVSIQDSRVIQVAPKGRLLIRNICMSFDLYLRNKQQRQKQFSKVI